MRSRQMNAPRTAAPQPATRHLNAVGRLRDATYRSHPTMCAKPATSGTGAVVFDLDGVLVDSETIWDEARRSLVARFGGSWSDGATRDMMGMSSREWSQYVRDELGVGLPVGRISTEVAAYVASRYDERLPLLPGAQDAVRRVAERWPIGLASSSNRSIIEHFLDASGLRDSFTATVSSEEVEHGKPAPDVYLAAAARLGVPPSRCVAIEDSTNGMRAALAAEMALVAVPNPHFPPDREVVAAADAAVTGLDDLTVELVEQASRSHGGANDE